MADFYVISTLALNINVLSIHIIQICSGIKSGRVLDGEILYAKILEINLFAFVYRLFQEGPVDWREIFIKVCGQMQTN